MMAKTTSLNVNPEIWKDFKKYCIDKEISMKNCIEAYIKQLLAVNSKKLK